MSSLPLWHHAEGYNLDFFVRLISWYLLSTTSWLAFYACFRWAPWQPRNACYDPATDTATRFAHAMISITLLLHLSTFLSRRARNNWTHDFRWTSNQWDKELAVVTGGTGELGSAIVERLVAKGIRVAVVDVSEPTKELGPNTRFFHCDLAIADDIRATADAVREALGHPTILVNNAGVVFPASILDATDHELELTFDVNTKSHYALVQSFLPEMISQNHGHVVTVASSTAYVSTCRGVSYCASKAAALAFHEGLAQELLHLYNAPAVRTSIVLPAHIKTKMFAGFDTGIPGASWFAPSLEVSTVADLIIGCIESGGSQHIIEPLYARLTVAGRILPSWIYKAALSLAKDALVKVERSPATSEDRPKDD